MKLGISRLVISCRMFENWLKNPIEADNLTKINITYRNRYSKHVIETVDFCLIDWLNWWYHWYARIWLDSSIMQELLNSDITNNTIFWIFSIIHNPAPINIIKILLPLASIKDSRLLCFCWTIDKTLIIYLQSGRFCDIGWISQLEGSDPQAAIWTIPSYRRGRKK